MSTLTAQEGRSSAVGLYVTIFYIGGSFGAFLTGLAFEKAGWPACVALVCAMIAVIAAVVAAMWRGQAYARDACVSRRRALIAVRSSIESYWLSRYETCRTGAGSADCSMKPEARRSFTRRPQVRDQRTRRRGVVVVDVVAEVHDVVARSPSR